MVPVSPIDPLDQLKTDIRKAVDAVVVLGITRVIEFGIPEGMVIARAADVLTAEQRADIAIALAVVESYDTTPVMESQMTVIVDPKDWNAIDHGISDGLIKRLRAIAEGGTE